MAYITYIKLYCDFPVVIIKKGIIFQQVRELTFQMYHIKFILLSNQLALF